MFPFGRQNLSSGPVRLSRIFTPESSKRSQFPFNRFLPDKKEKGVRKSTCIFRVTFALSDAHFQKKGKSPQINPKLAGMKATIPVTPKLEKGETFRLCLSPIHEEKKQRPLEISIPSSPHFCLLFYDGFRGRHL